MEPHFVGEVTIFSNWKAQPAAPWGRPPRTLLPCTRGIAIVARGFKSGRPSREGERALLNEVTMTLGATHASKKAGAILAGQGIQQEKFMTAPPAQPEHGSRQYVSKISSFGHGLVTV